MSKGSPSAPSSASKRPSTTHPVALVVPPRRRLRTLLIVGLVLGTGLASYLAINQTIATRQREAIARFAHQRFTAGTLADLRSGAERIEQQMGPLADDGLLGARALILAQAWLEFREDKIPAHDAVADFIGQDDMPGDARLAIAMVNAADGDFDGARARLQELAAERSELPARAKWLGALLDLLEPSLVVAATTELEELVKSNDSVAYRRLLVRALLQSGRTREAFSALAQARERSPEHLGLAADEALFHLSLRQKITSVADLADQLLANVNDSAISKGDLAHAQLARGAAYILNGNPTTGIELLQRSWEFLPPWDRVGRRLALDMALEVGNEELATKWLDEVGLGGQEVEIYRAWQEFVAGDMMACLARCAKLPQEHPRIALLQGLALVEQGRYEEAEPWLLRADKLNPGRVEIEVALARVEIQLGDRRAALRKLEVLSEDEPFAPRVWTGLGEAHLALVTGAAENTESRELARRRALAQQALERALERERRPAEAMVRLADVWDGRRKEDPTAAVKALDLLEKAAKLNPNLPRYREKLALYLAQLGYDDRALTLLDEVLKEPGIKPDTVLVSIRLRVSALLDGDDSQTEKLNHDFALAEHLVGVQSLEIRRERARVDLLTGGREGASRALLALESILSESPQDVSSIVLRAQATERLGDREKAIEVLRRGLRHVPKAKRGLLYAQWARYKADTGQRKGAAAHARVAWHLLRDQPTPARDLLACASLATSLYISSEKYDSGLRVATELTRVLPSHSQAWVILANVQFKMGEISNALRSATQAVELDANNPRAHELLGLCHLRYGSREAASAAFTRALEHTSEPAMQERLKRYLRG